MKVTPTTLPEVLLIDPTVHSDARGYFFESFHTQRYAEHGMQLDFVQDNFSHSHENVLRGLHYQIKNLQGKLVWVTQGKVLDVVVDVRDGSPRFGQWVSVVLDAKKPQQLYVPPGFAHGFCVLSKEVDFCYKCTDYYYPEAERGIAWNDPDLNIPWSLVDPILSAKDQQYPNLKNVPKEFLPKYKM